MRSLKTAFLALSLAAAVALSSVYPAAAFFYSVAVKNARMDVITSQIGSGGRMRLYTVGGGATPCSGTLLADLALSSPAAPAASGGVLTFSTITADTSADNTGSAVCAKLTTSSGTAVVDGLTVGTTGADVNLLTTSIVANGTVSMAGPNRLTHP
jgi:hypothetical protein